MSDLKLLLPTPDAKCIIMFNLWEIPTPGAKRFTNIVMKPLAQSEHYLIEQAWTAFRRFLPQDLFHCVRSWISIPDCSFAKPWEMHVQTHKPFIVLVDRACVPACAICAKTRVQYAWKNNWHWNFFFKRNLRQIWVLSRKASLVFIK